jgi:predicted nucleotidyltransferase
MYNLNEQKILEVFFKSPTAKFNLLELARLTKLHPNTTINTLKKLEKLGLVKQERKKYIKEIYANKENPNFNLEKKIFNLKKIYESNIIQKLVKEFSPDSISIIGSYSKGEDIENSDIDILVISKKEYSNANLKEFEKKLGRPIHLIVTQYKEMSEEFYINLINGIVLYGAINKK